MSNFTDASFMNALSELIEDYKLEGQVASDAGIRLTAKRYGVDACELYAAYNEARSLIPVGAAPQ